jgi:hypothetical protein
MVVHFSPYTLQQIYALERVQRQAARFVTGDYSSRDPGSVTRMLQQLQWDTLEERRARSVGDESRHTDGKYVMPERLNC